MAERGVPTTYLLDAHTSIVGLWRLLKHGSQRRLIAFLAHALRFQVATGASKCAVVDEPLQLIGKLVCASGLRLLPRPLGGLQGPETALVVNRPVSYTHLTLPTIYSV